MRTRPTAAQMAAATEGCRATSLVLKIKYGDALHIHGEGSENSPEDWYAVAKQDADASRDDSLDVEYLVRTDQPGVWQFDGDVYECPVSAIVAHASVDERRGPQYAWADLGFRMLGASTMARHDYAGELPVGDEEFELCSDTEETDSMRDFIVPDDQVEPFRPASDAGDGFVDDTHAAVRAWNGWVPANDRQKSVKEFIDNMAARAAHMDDDRRMQTGQPPLESYTEPT